MSEFRIAYGHNVRAARYGCVAVRPQLDEELTAEFFATHMVNNCPVVIMPFASGRSDETEFDLHFGVHVQSKIVYATARVLESILKADRHEVEIVEDCVTIMNGQSLFDGQARLIDVSQKNYAIHP